jgi:hypothetical protein
MVSLSCTPEYAVAGAEAGRLTVNMRVLAPYLPDEAKRAPVSLSCVLDKSGSMAGAKLALVKRSVCFMLDHLGPRDKIGIVEYDSEVNELIPTSRTTKAFKREAEALLNSMRDGSCTNLSGGLFKGIEQQQAGTYLDWDDLSQEKGADTPLDGDSWVMVDDAASATSMSSMSSLAHRVDQAQWLAGSKGEAQQSPTKRCRSAAPASCKKIFAGVQAPAAKTVEEDAMKTVFLFTDGLANVGLREDAIVPATQSLLSGSQAKPKVYTFGFGADHSEKLLGELAEVGQGSYYYLEKEEHIPRAFADALGGLLSVAAQNVTVEFVPEEDVVVETMHTPFQVTDTGAGRKVSCGDLFSEESKDILVDLALPKVACVSEERDFKLGTLKVSYFDVATSRMLASQVELAVRRAAVVPADIEPDLNVALQRMRLETVAALSQCGQLAAQGDYDGARSGLEQTLKRAAALVMTAQLKDSAIVAGIARVLVADLEDAMTDTRDADVYQAKGRKSIRMKAAVRGAQRCDFSSPSKTWSAVDEDEEVKRFAGGSARQRSMKGGI